MPNIKIRKQKLLKIITYVLPVFALIFANCSSKELSRSKAQSLIEGSSDYKQPFALQLMQGDIVNLKEGLESSEQAANASTAEARATKEYLELYPQVAVANHLGLVGVRVKAMDLEESKRRFMDGGAYWHLDEKYLPTDKGKALWKEYNLPPTTDTIPVAKKEVIEITGVTKQGEDAAQAQFTWKFVPNDVGKAFDTSTSEFKNLPTNLQQLLDGTLPASDVVFKRKNQTMSFVAVRPGQAMFRRYDDGWRLEAVMFQ